MGEAVFVPSSRVSASVAADRSPASANSESPPRTYHERKVSGWCTYSSACPRRQAGWPEPTHLCCPRHRNKVQASQAKRVAATRRELADAGRCTKCRKPSSTWRCAACKELDFPSSSSVPASVAADVDARIARIRARTVKESDGRTRYRGRDRRGQLTHEQLDEMDIAQARRYLAAGIARLEQWRTPEVQQLGLIERTSVRRQATDELALAVGFLEEIMARNGHYRTASSRRAER